MPENNSPFPLYGVLQLPMTKNGPNGPDSTGRPLAPHCYIKCPFLGLGASFGQFSSNGISFHHELIFAMGLEF